MPFQVVLDAWRHREILFVRLQSELQKEVAGTRLGYLWMLLDPLILAGVYFFVVVFVFERGGPDFYLTVLSGVWFWTWVSKSISQGAISLTSNRSLLLSMPTPFSLFVLGPLLLNAIYFAIGTGALIALVGRLSFLAGLYALCVVGLTALFCYAAAFLAALATVRFRDVPRILSYLLRLGFFLSPVIYEADRVLENPKVPEWAVQLYVLNPVASLLTTYRDTLVHNRVESLPASLVVIAALSLLAILLCERMVQRNRNTILERL